jgi:hypothetical protein
MDGVFIYPLPLLVEVLALGILIDVVGDQPGSDPGGLEIPDDLLVDLGVLVFPSPVKIKSTRMAVGVVDVLSHLPGLFPVYGQVDPFCSIREGLVGFLLFLGHHEIPKPIGHAGLGAGLQHIIPESVVKGVNNVGPLGKADLYFRMVIYKTLVVFTGGGTVFYCFSQ